MATQNTSGNNKSLIIVFYIQLSILLLISLLFAIGMQSDLVGDFWFALLLGALGASVSLMQKIKNGQFQLITAETDASMLPIMMPILYGIIMTSIAYLLFMSGILSGDNGGGLFTTNIFPNFTNPNLGSLDASDSKLVTQFSDIHPDGIVDTGKLLVWCFITGYSEKFVSGILHKVEGAGAGDVADEEQAKDYQQL